MLKTKSEIGSRKGKGRIPYGLKIKNGVVVIDPQGQQVIGLMRVLREEGLSYNNIAEELMRLYLPSPNNGIWYGESVRKILARC